MKNESKDKKAPTLALIEAKLQEIEASRAKIREMEEEFKETELRRVATIQRKLAGKEGKGVAKIQTMLAKVRELQEKRVPFGVYVEAREQTFFDKAKKGVALLRNASQEDFDKIKLQTIEDFETYTKSAQANRKAWGSIAQKAVKLWDKIQEARDALKV